ncbi:antibiotic biosynthesis monooxygenase [Geodermatophilus arenarius]|uniref:Antibiotic biosynthesis monooxygenase n=1 Tax=Geodermatophilus arenarius TaxID=1137990 RepID=A0ABV9LJD0_9ACTN
MYARSTSVAGTPERLDDGIAFVCDEVMPALADMRGFVGLSMLTDRASGRAVVTSSWRDVESMRASADRVRALRDQAAEVFGGDVTVQEWEVAVMHRRSEAPSGACTRVTWWRADPAGLDRVLDAYRSVMVPRMEDYPGFCSVSLMVDRESGRAASAVTFEDRDDMDAGRAHARASRDDFARAMKLEITDAEEFDLVLAHLRVPETV